MWIKFILLLLLSLLVIFAMPYAQQAIQLLLNAHDWVSELLTEVFAGAQPGNLLRGLIALIAVPFAIGLIPSVPYWLFRRSAFPYFMDIVWMVWLAQTGALLATYNVAG